MRPEALLDDALARAGDGGISRETILLKLADVAGHSNIETLKHYLALAEDRRRRRTDGASALELQMPREGLEAADRVTEGATRQPERIATMDTADFIRSLNAVGDSASFAEICLAQTSMSPHVSMNLVAANGLVDDVLRHQARGWDWFLGSPDEDLRRVVADYCLGSSLNGGYFTVAADGQIAQWERGGSGSNALVDWLADVRTRGLQPGIDITEPTEVLKALGADLAGQPHTRKRAAICCEFADQGRLDELVSMVAATETTLKDGSQGYRFCFSDVQRLVTLYPEGFGEDPFRKKAILFFLLLSGHFVARGRAVENDLPIPSDYQMGRGFAWKGIISVAPGLAAMLRSDAMLDVWSGEVMDYRAAAVVAARCVGGLAGREDWLVDGGLFGTWRKTSEFRTESLPPARCNSIWF
jgi:hypothetical protein